MEAQESRIVNSPANKLAENKQRIKSWNFIKSY